MQQGLFSLLSANQAVFNDPTPPIVPSHLKYITLPPTIAMQFAHERYSLSLSRWAQFYRLSMGLNDRPLPATPLTLAHLSQRDRLSTFLLRLPYTTDQMHKLVVDIARKVYRRGTAYPTIVFRIKVEKPTVRYTTLFKPVIYRGTWL